MSKFFCEKAPGLLKEAPDGMEEATGQVEAPVHPTWMKKATKRARIFLMCNIFNKIYV